MDNESKTPANTRVRFFYVDRQGDPQPLSTAEYAALHDDLNYRRLVHFGGAQGVPPPHTRNPELAGRTVVVIEVVVAVADRRVIRVDGMRGFRSPFDEDGRLNLENAERHLRTAVERRDTAEFMQAPTTEQAALIRAHLYRRKHAERGSSS